MQTTTAVPRQMTNEFWDWAQYFLSSPSVEICALCWDPSDMRVCAGCAVYYDCYREERWLILNSDTYENDQKDGGTTTCPTALTEIN